MTTHYLKTHPKFFHKVISGKKPCEIRRDDRGYAIGDTLYLEEWHPDYGYSGQKCSVLVTDLTRLDGIGIPGWVYLDIELLHILQLPDAPALPRD